MVSKKLILIGNYISDNQVSMARFCQFLAEGISSSQKFEVEVWCPPIVLGRFSKSHQSGVGKWLGYADKWLFGRALLGIKVARDKLQWGEKCCYHICDHSNAPYLVVLPRARASLTCHDVLAIMGAFGDQSAFCQASSMGIILQKWILIWLKRCEKIAFVSKKTKKDFLELVPKNQTNSLGMLEVIPNGYNRPFFVMSSAKSSEVLRKENVNIKGEFFLHVGSDLPRKNRELLVDVLSERKDEWSGQLVFAGAAPGAKLLKKIDESGLRGRIVCLERPDHEVLVALYSTCHAFLFPSFSEGFGWPLIEAQACGAVVVASDLAPFPEVGGDGALYADPHSASSFAEASRRLDEQKFRDDLVARGLKNAMNYQPERIISNYEGFLNS